jgi:hypothetical protein
MGPARLSESDLFGRLYLKIPDLAGFEAYFKSLDILRPFLESNDWKKSVTGYYLNAFGSLDTVRLSYFSSVPDKVAGLIKEFCSSENIEQNYDEEQPHEVKIAEPYGGEEMRFRIFLSTYSPIALDIMKKDLLGARCLIATFRWQITLSHVLARQHFENIFMAQSPSYNSLSLAQKEQFLLDLGYWPNPPQVDWAHMMVNMILPGDWIKGGKWEYFLTPKPAKTINEINDIIKELNFQIPPGWHPSV